MLARMACSCALLHSPVRLKPTYIDVAGTTSRDVTMWLLLQSSKRLNLSNLCRSHTSSMITARHLELKQDVIAVTSKRTRSSTLCKEKICKVERA
jgi:hypothetical protein